MFSEFFFHKLIRSYIEWGHCSGMKKIMNFKIHRSLLASCGGVQWSESSKQGHGDSTLDLKFKNKTNNFPLVSLTKDKLFATVTPVLGKCLNSPGLWDWFFFSEIHIHYYIYGSLERSDNSPAVILEPRYLSIDRLAQNRIR